MAEAAKFLDKINRECPVTVARFKEIEKNVIDNS